MRAESEDVRSLPIFAEHGECYVIVAARTAAALKTAVTDAAVH